MVPDSSDFALPRQAIHAAAHGEARAGASWNTALGLLVHRTVRLTSAAVAVVFRCGNGSPVAALANETPARKGRRAGSREPSRAS